MPENKKILKREDISSRMDLSEQLEQDLDTGSASMDGGGKVLSQDFINASEEGKRIILQAREEARKIKADALAIYQKIQDEVTKAKEKGYEEGTEEAKAEFTELMTAAHHAKEKLFENIERDTIKLIYDISEKILGHEFAQRETAIVDLIRQALQTAMGQKIIILVNPADLDNVRKNQAMLMQLLDNSRSLQIRGDEKVKPSGCIIETEAGTIDAQLETQLAAVRKALEIEEEE